MATYTELANHVLSWANRDEEVLRYDVIIQCIRYAHDEAYRTLRIAPLEITRSGTVTQAQVDQEFLRIENDLVEFIQLRKKASEGPRSYSPFDKPYIVAEAHSDARSFRGDTITLYSNYAFYREGTEIHIWPRIQLGEVWELYYYRRLPEANERFDIDELIADEGLSNSNIRIKGVTSAAAAVITFNTSDIAVDRFTVGDILTLSGASIDGYNADDYEVTAVSEVDTDGEFTVTTNKDTDVLADLPSVTAVRVAWNSSILLVDFKKYFEKFSVITANDKEADTETFTDMFAGFPYAELGINVVGISNSDKLVSYVGVLKQQWLRDTNEKVLLFGALHQAFDYLDEADQSEKYKAKFEQEIAKLNKEDMDRMNSGGNINVNFYNNLI